MGTQEQIVVRNSGAHTQRTGTVVRQWERAPEVVKQIERNTLEIASWQLMIKAGVDKPGFYVQANFEGRGTFHGVISFADLSENMPVRMNIGKGKDLRLRNLKSIRIIPDPTINTGK